MLKDTFHRFETIVDMWLQSLSEEHLFQVLPLIFLESSKILISTCSHNRTFLIEDYKELSCCICVLTQFDTIDTTKEHIIQEWKTFRCYYICHSISFSRLKDRACFFKMSKIRPYFLIGSYLQNDIKGSKC